MNIVDYEVFELEVCHVHPSPENDEIYGAIDPADNDFINLANDIAKNGVREAIVISADCFILSGHRRYAAAKLVGLERVPVRFIDDVFRESNSPEEWKRKLTAYNQQRVKSPVMRLKEAALQIDADIAYQQLCYERDQQHQSELKHLSVEGEKVRSEISPGKQEMLQAAIRIIESLREFWPLSVRQIHYQLLNDPPLRNTARKKKQQYQNNRNSYQDLSNLLCRARIAGFVGWEAISDETRPVSNIRFRLDASEFFDNEFHNFLRYYRRDLLQSQLDHVELIVEKLTVQNIIAPIANKYCIPTTIGRGFCSIDPRKEIVDRFKASGKRKIVLLLVADFDPDGEVIAESFVRSIRDDFKIDAGNITASKILLRSDQVKDWKLPTNAEEAKKTSKGYPAFFKKYGSGQVFELEAVAPLRMQQVVEQAIRAAIDVEAFEREVETERQDAVRLAAMKSAAREFFANSDLSELD